jgi:ABC-type nitrate/sulfonate/bicarbonate transport system ATPase subunit
MAFCSRTLVTHNVDEALKMGQKIILLSGRPSKVIKIFTDLSKKDEIKKELKNTIYKYEQIR